MSPNQKTHPTSFSKMRIFSALFVIWPYFRETPSAKLSGTSHLLRLKILSFLEMLVQKCKIRRQAPLTPHFRQNLGGNHSDSVTMVFLTFIFDSSIFFDFFLNRRNVFFMRTLRKNRRLRRASLGGLSLPKPISKTRIIMKLHVWDISARKEILGSGGEAPEKIFAF